jgi:hypothetical protein
MKTKSKIWLGVGAFVVTGTGAVGGHPTASAETPPVSGFHVPTGFATDTAVPRSAGVVIAQHGDHGKDAGKDAGEGGEGERVANLPPDLAFAVRIALLRGHLLVGDELVRQGQWNAGLPHFLHPTEELYEDLRVPLNDYHVPPFDDALKALAATVKAKKSADYAKALKPVNDALAAADAGMKAKQSDWDAFVVETAIESIKTAADEYAGAIVGGKIVKPVEYQDARGFISQADRMIESVAAGLQKKDPDALKQVRAGLAELKKAFPAAMPPTKPVKDHAGLLAVVSRIELASGKLM